MKKNSRQGDNDEINLPNPCEATENLHENKK